MKSINPRLLALALAGLLSATAASALAAQSLPGATPGAPATPSGEPSIKTYDSNGDGMISIEEFKPKGGQEQAFREADANRDNSPSNDEHMKASANKGGVKASAYMDDAWITAKVRSLLLKEEGVKGLGVNVETYQGTVQLSGWVNTPTQITQAEKIALAVEGVKGIRNDLQIKR